MNLPGYLLNASCCLAVFYLVYWLGLRKLTFFAANRAYLLLTSVVSGLLPALRLPALLPVENPQLAWLPGGPASLPAEAGYPLALPAAEALPFSPEPALPALYLAGAAWMLGRLVLRLGRLVGLLRRPPAGSYEGYRVVRLEGPLSNASFLHTIFLDARHLDAREQALVLVHERSHLQHWHSLDVLWMEVLKVVLWFNPVVYLYGRSLQLLHEFQADAAAGAGEGRREYAHLLLRLGSRPVPSPAHSFGGPLLTRRIHTLFAAPSRGWRRLHYLLFVPALAAGLVLAGCNREDYAVPAAGQAPLLFVDGRERPFSSLGRVDTASVSGIRVYRGDQAVQKIGPRAQRGAIFLTTGATAPGTARATLFLPGDQTLSLSRLGKVKGELLRRATFSRPGEEDVVAEFGSTSLFWNGYELDVDDALALKPAFFLGFLRTDAFRPKPEGARP